MSWKHDPARWRPGRSLPVAFFLLSQLMVGGGARAAALPDLGAVKPAASAVTRGWQQVNLPSTGSYFDLYVPPAWDGTKALPLVVFLHGSGSPPEDYEAFLFPAADTVQCLVAAPRAASLVGWGTGNDDQTVAATVSAVEAMLPVDVARVGIAGHSSGGAFAYLTAYGTVSRYNAVFSMSAPFYAVSSVADPAYKAPIHMYYGTTDPNYTGGAYAELQQQWETLGVSWESDVEAGFGHNPPWPSDTVAKGFQFLLSKSYGTTCVPDASHACLQAARFRVSLTWQDSAGHTGVGSLVPAAVSSDSAVLWFFDPSNWEMLVKVLDGCGLNQRIWVFAAATTNVQYTLTITDTVTGQVKSYQNAGGQTAAVITDTNAFASCP
ncbi:MAG TPA: alpha/beta fold hydrolase [Thermoanaerobaculia bacterium]|nr:alpha/beta fold hydrolase [Thermoanaerobaculia bacterium]